MAYKKEEKLRFLEHLMKRNGNISKACEEAGIPRRTFYEWLKEDEFKSAYEDIQEKELDDAEDTLRILRRGIPKLDAEGKMIGWLLYPDTTANVFYLKTKGKARGYVERQEIVNPEDKEISIRIIHE